MVLLSPGAPLKIAGMESGPKAAGVGTQVPFAAGAIIVLTLHTPREKFWGALLELSPAGVSVCGVDLNSFDDFAALVKSGEAGPCVVFFPMQRVERIELDARNGEIPAISDRFTGKTGRTAASVLICEDYSRSEHS